MAWETVQAKLVEAFMNAWSNFVNAFADLIVLIGFLVIGYIVGRFVSYLVKNFLKRVKFEKWLEERGIADALPGFTLTGVFDKIIKLVSIAVFLGIAAEVTELVFVRDLVLWFIGYVPLLLQGLAILILALIGGDYVTDRIKASNIPFARFIGVVFEVLVVYTALVISLPLILPNADVDILKNAFTLIITGVILAFSLGFAIAFGLGAKDVVREVAKKKEKDLEKLF